MIKDEIILSRVLAVPTVLGLLNKQPVLLKALNFGIGVAACTLAVNNQKDKAMTLSLVQAGISSVYALTNKTNGRVAAIYTATSLIACGINYYSIKQNIKLHNDVEKALKD